MNVLITAGPTRECIDSVRFLSNASSGRMGCAVAAAALRAGHDVTLLHGPMDGALLTDLNSNPACTLVQFTSVADLQAALAEQLPRCDALVMSAAVGDFTVQNASAAKLRRKAGPITLRLVPTPDLLAGVADVKQPNQKIVSFAVEDPPHAAAETKARAELTAKGADFVVVNTPAAMGAEKSDACILSATEILLPWANRPKEELAEQIISLLAKN